jgi:hypothetical protein
MTKKDFVRGAERARRRPESSICRPSGLKQHSRLEHVMDTTIVGGENEGGALQSLERKAARRFVGHRTFLTGFLYVIAIIVILAIVSRL